MKMLKHTVVVAVLCMTVAATGCSKGSDGAVIAKVNRGAITAGEFKQQIAGLPQQMQQAVVSDPKARKEFLDDLIGIELVIQEAKQLGLDRDAEFKKRQEMRRKEMEQRLQEDGRNELFNTVLKKELGDKLTNIPEPTDQEVRDYYAKNKDKIRDAGGRQLSLKEVQPRLKSILSQQKRRDLYLDYAKALRAKAKITVDDKALDAAAVTVFQPTNVDLSHMQVQPAPKKEAAQK